MDVDPDLPPRADPPVSPLVATAAVAAGGVVGALGRAGLGELWPHEADEWAWSTFVVNASGAVLVAVLLVTLEARFPHHRYTRPLLGTGLLGGYTTFSTLAVDAAELARADRPVLAATYVVASTAAVLLGVLLGVALTRRALGGTGRGAAP